MDSANVDVFFSCSFSDDDKGVNNFFSAICKALDMSCVNVQTAYTKIPPDKAKEIIRNCNGLVAICTKRRMVDKDKYIMPSAVQDEISFSYGMDVPVLIFVEEGVEIDGFQNNYGTHLRFDRTQLNTPENIEKIVSALHSFKMDLVSPYDPIFYQNTSELYSEYTHSLYELKESDGDYFWSYATTKKLVFLLPYKRALRIGTWATVPSIVPPNAKPIEWNITVDNSSNNIQINTVVEEHTAQSLEAILKFDPHPEKGDFVEYSISQTSKYFNPIWEDDTSGLNGPCIEDWNYKCYDGIIPIHRMKKLLLEFRFPRSYGLKKNEIRPFVGSYTSKVDYLVESEIERMNVEFDSFAGNLSVRIEAESPLLRHLYGIAWNPKSR